MKWTLVGFLGFGCILAIAASSGIPLFGQSPNGNGLNRPSPPGPPNGQAYYSAFPGGTNFNALNVPRKVTKIGPDGIPQTTVDSFTVPGAPPNEEGRQALLRGAQAKLRASDATESDKKEARTAIEKFLEDEFERDQKMRREQVTRLEEQVSKLQKQLDKREQSKSKIIELRMQLMENDAEGLSFPESFNELQRSGYDVPHPYSPMGQVPTYYPVQNPVAYGQWNSMNPFDPSLNKGEVIGTPNKPMPPNMNRPPEAKRP